MRTAADANCGTESGELQGLQGCNLRTSADDPRGVAANLQAAAVELGMVITGDGRVALRDMCKLVGYSARRMRELREEGRSLPRHRSAVDGCMFSVSFADAALWLADRREDI
jgi:hypothetical protein